MFSVLVPIASPIKQALCELKDIFQLNYDYNVSDGLFLEALNKIFNPKQDDFDLRDDSTQHQELIERAKNIFQSEDQGLVTYYLIRAFYVWAKQLSRGSENPSVFYNLPIEALMAIIDALLRTGKFNPDQRNFEDVVIDIEDNPSRMGHHVLFFGQIFKIKSGYEWYINYQTQNDSLRRGRKTKPDNHQQDSLLTMAIALGNPEFIEKIIKKSKEINSVYMLVLKRFQIEFDFALSNKIHTIPLCTRYLEKWESIVNLLHYCGKELGLDYTVDYSNYSTPPYPSYIFSLYKQITDSRKFVADLKEKAPGFDAQLSAKKMTELFNRYATEYFTARAHAGLANQIANELSKPANQNKSFDECWQIMNGFLSDEYRQMKPIYLYGSFAGLLKEIIHMAIKDDQNNYQYYLILLNGINSLTVKEEPTFLDKCSNFFGIETLSINVDHKGQVISRHEM